MMTSRQRLQMTTMCVALVVACALPVSAQDERPVALTMAFPAEVGVLWQVSDRVALRPDVGFTWSEQAASFGDDDFGAYTSESSSSSVTTGLSVLFTVARWEQLRAYLVPRVGYTFLSNRSLNSFGPSPGVNIIIGGVSGGISGGVQTERDEANSRAFELSGAFGVQYSLGERFGVYGEAGIAYTSAKYPVSSSSDENRMSAAGIRSMVGVLFRF